MAASVNTPNPPRRMRVGLWTMLSLAGAILLTIGISVLEDYQGEPLFDTPVITQTLSTIAIIGAAFGPSVYATRQDTKIVRHEVKNDHRTNFRDESDSRHSEVAYHLSEIRRDIGGIRVELRDDRKYTRDSVHEVRESILRLDSQVRDLKQLGSGKISHEQGEG